METKLSLSVALALVLFSPLSAMALSEQECFDAYASVAGHYKTAGVPLQYGGIGMTLGGTTAGVAGFASAPTTAVAILGGTSVGSTGDSLVATAYFAGNVAQSMAEARAKVVGPYTSQLAADLNDAVNDSGRFQPKVENGHMSYSSPLSDETKSQLRGLLRGQKVSGAQLSAVTGLLAKSGGLCSVDGSTLGQDEWARLVVTYVAQQAQ